MTPVLAPNSGVGIGALAVHTPCEKALLPKQRNARNTLAAEHLLRIWFIVASISHPGCVSGPQRIWITSIDCHSIKTEGSAVRLRRIRVKIASRK
jgi:hypothetical protein